MTEATLVVLAYGALATLALTLEVMMSKCLSKRGVDGGHAGITFLFFEGLIGTTILLISTAFTDGGLHILTWEDIAADTAASTFGFAAVTLLQVSVATGLAGLAICIYNTNTVFLTALAFVVLN